MKLSNRIFVTAYITVIICLGISGTFLIENVTKTLLEAELKQVKYANAYAAESFNAFADISYEKLTDAQRKNIIAQIKSGLGNSVKLIEISTIDETEKQYKALKDNQGVSHYIENGEALMLKSTCRLNTAVGVYYMSLYFDLTHTVKQERIFKEFYGITVLLFSALSGLLLLFVAKRATAPLNQLKNVAYDIASGDYGKTVDIKSRDTEIVELSESFNSMSKTVAQKIDEIQKEAEKRDLFVADFTHEIKTPMTAIIGYSQMLDSYPLTKEEQSDAVKTIHRESKRLESLSLQLLDLYVLKNETPALYPVNLKEIEKQLKATLKFSCEKYGVTLKTDLADKWVTADKNLILSLLYNLCDNAFKASNKNDFVEVYSKEDGNKIKICVKDNGKGVSAENIKMLTEPFFREDKSRSRRLGGAGLGLSICKKIAEIHSSGLTFESEEGKGCIVSFGLDIEKEERNEDI